MQVLDINDIGLRLADAEQVLSTEPGFASLDGGQIIVGEAARCRSRLQPRLSHARYWYQLDQLPLDRSLGNARSTADLAYWQLRQMRAAAEGRPLLLAVPSSFDTAQLGLLLGLCQAAELGAVGLVDSAVAAVASGAPAGPLLHVDVQLHRVWMTRIEVGEYVQRGSGHDLTKPGLMAVWDAAAAMIAEAFVRQTRFDPLHSAATEQLLYDQLPDWLNLLAGEAVASLTLTVAGRSHRISVSREGLIAALHPIYGRIVGALQAAQAHTPGARVVLSDRASGLPGLAPQLRDALGHAPVVLNALAAAQGALAHLDAIRGDPQALPWVTRLPARVVEGAVAPPGFASDAAVVAATHVLEGDDARRLSDGFGAALGLRLRQGARGWIAEVRDGATINGRPMIPDTVLGAGDVLEVEGRQMRLIRVLE